jgi:phosphoenolpyruvate-protein phosphotransferase
LSAPLVVLAPFPGWCLPLAEVPDEVFAQALAGDGLAIDPTAGSLVAPCDATVVPMRDARHALTLRTAIGVDLMIHVGIDTVGLKGEGFELRVAPGDRVRAGQELLRFDLDLLARRAPSLVSPIVLPAGGAVVRRTTGRAIEAGQPIMEIVAQAQAAAAAGGTESRRELVMAFDHGLHVRPAARVVAALKPFACEVTLAFRGRTANARSTVSMMSLGAQRGDVIVAVARGPDADKALGALEALLPKPVNQGVLPSPTPSGMPQNDEQRAKRAAGVHVGSAKEEPLDSPRRIGAAIASRGVAIGRVTHFEESERVVAETGAGERGERAALERALEVVRERLRSQAQKARAEHRALLEGHAELAADPELFAQAGQWLERGKSAAYAWRRASRAVADSLAALDDARMRERAADLRDLEGQVLAALAGEDPSARSAFPADAVLVADDLPPSAIAALERGAIAGFCTARGGPTSHLAILAAAAGIPALVAAGDGVLSLAEGTRVVLDAEHGWLDVDPPAAELAAAERSAAQREQERLADAAAARDEAHTRDGVRVRVHANLGGLEEVAGAIERGAEGCGLLRTEFLFLDRDRAPDEEEQRAEYEAISAALGDRPLTIRTLDPGGDKPLAYLALPAEDNPALGMRGVRASLAEPGLLRTQLRAIIRSGPAPRCRILVPMVTDVEELSAVRSMAQECARELGTATPPVGAMIETPASALLADALARAADFLSIGSNDLAQYALAMDRGHPELARRLDALHPAVLRLVALVAEAGHSHGKPVSLCGAMGSDVDALGLLIGLGVHEVSAAPSAIPRLKRTARLLDAAECREAAQRALELDSAAQVRDLAAVLRSRARASSTTPAGGSR